MGNLHTEYSEYCMCDVCRMMKYCALKDGWYVCYACDSRKNKGDGNDTHENRTDK